MRVATKLSAAFALHIALLGALLIYHVRTIRDAVDTGRELSEISSRVHITSTRQLGRITRLKENAAKYSVTRDPGYRDKFRDLYAAYDTELRQLRTLPLGEQEHAELEALAAGWAAVGPLTAWMDESLRAAPPHRAQALLDPLQEALDRLRLQTQRVTEASQAVMAARLERSALAAREAERLSWFAAGGALLLSALISALIVRSISEPLQRLTDGTREVAEGRFDYRLDSSRGDEFAQVARDFNTMTARLDELDRMKRDFISKVSHDLKTPLASMQETIDVLLDEVPGPLAERQRRLLLLNQESGQRLASMLAKLLDLSWLEFDLAPELQVMEPTDLVHRAVEQAEAACAERELRIVVHEPDQQLLLECNGDRIRQLLDNLLENAIKFSPVGGEVTLTLRVSLARPDDVPPDRWTSVHARPGSEGVLLIAVSDRGPGVSDAHKDRIFERFYQTETGRAVRNRGVGLGLTICREIVAAHGGAIWVTDNPGAGSIFQVLLPGALCLPRECTLAVGTTA